MKSKALEYIKRLGKKTEELPEKYRENLETMQEFAEIYSLVEPDSEEAQEAKAEYEDYDEKILEALKRDYPLEEGGPKSPAPTPKFRRNDRVITNKGEPGIVYGSVASVDENGEIRYGILLDGHEKAKMILEKKLKKGDDMPMPPIGENGQRRIDKAALDALEAHLMALPQTKELHTDKKGGYTAERKSLHEDIIKGELSGSVCVKQDAPIAILTGGLPGSGKSTFIRKNRDWMTNPAIFKIDADEVRAKLPEYKGWNASQTHQESRDIVNQLIEKIGAHGCSYDIIYDGTMNKAEKYGPLIKKLKEEGYQVFILYMMVDKATSMKRAMERYKKSGRYVPRFVIEEAAENGLAAFNEIKEMVDGYVLVDGVSGKMLEKGGKEIPENRDYDKLSGDDEPSAGRTPAPNRVTEYNWKDKADMEQLSPIVIHCQHYHLEAQEEMEVGLKGKGNATRKVPVKPGEHLIFDDKGYLVFVMDAESFDRKCIEQGTVEAHETEKHKSGEKPESKPEPAQEPKAREEAKPAGKGGENPDPVEKEAQPAPAGKKKTATKPKAADKPKADPKPQAEPNPTIASIEKEINDIRLAQGKKPMDRDLFRKEYQDLDEHKETQAYLGYIRKQLKQAQGEGVEFSEEDIIKLGIAIRPLIQRKGAALLDILLTSKKVLAPTYDNLIRWTESPGRYDLQGVDISVKAKESVKARKVEEPSLFDLIGW